MQTVKHVENPTACNKDESKYEHHLQVTCLCVTNYITQTDVKALGWNLVSGFGVTHVCIDYILVVI